MTAGEDVRLAVWALAALWVLWTVPVLALRTRSKGVERAHTANYSWIGLVLQTASYPLVFLFRGAQFGWVRGTLALLCGLGSLWLMWTAIPVLGKQWRLAAGVNVDHQLVQSGPYGIVRHPIYTSMLGLLLASGFVITPPWPLAISLGIFAIGTWIRVDAEEKLLAQHFGKAFEEYRRRVPAILPWI